MTESVSASVATPPAKSSFWEDLIDIFYAPAGVFRRWQFRSAWPAMLFVAIAIGVIMFFTFSALEPLFDAEFTRRIAEAVKRTGVTPPPEQLAISRNFSNAIVRYGVGGIMLVTMFILGSIAFLVGKLFGSKQTYGAALVVAGWAYMPRVIDSVLGGVQGLLMDPSKLTSRLAISLGPARFFDPDATNQLLLQLMGRLDLITIWVTVLLAVGLYVTGKVSKSNAVLFGIAMWVLGSIPVLWQAYFAM
ncbi:MAG TPA: YIP1 family protein [Gemmatimonadaceae bacterium]|jgi:hypothetical protein